MNSEGSKNSKSSSKRQSLNIQIPSANSIAEKTSKELENVELTNEDAQYKQSSEKIQGLVKKMLNMQKDEKDRDDSMEEKFKSLRKRINNSVSFLESTKHQIENIKFLYQQDKLHTMNKQSFGDCLSNSHQSVEELDVQMNDIQKKLNAVRERAKNSKEAHNKRLKEQNFESAMAETVGALENIGMGDYIVEK